MKSIPVFKKSDGKTYRLVSKFRKVWERGYAEPSEEMFNLLQVKTWWGWKTVEEEHVPSFVWISMGTVGFCDWQSPLVLKHKPKVTV